MLVNLHPEFQTWMDASPKGARLPNVAIGDLPSLMRKMRYGKLYLAEKEAPQFDPRDDALVFPDAYDFELDGIEGDCKQLSVRLLKLLKLKHPNSGLTLSMAKGTDQRFFREEGCHQFPLASAERKGTWLIDPSFQEIHQNYNPHHRVNYEISEADLWSRLDEQEPRQKVKFKRGAGWALTMSPDKKALLELINAGAGQMLLMNRTSATIGQLGINDPEFKTQAAIERLSQETRGRIKTLCEKIFQATGQRVQLVDQKNFLKVREQA